MGRRNTGYPLEVEKKYDNLTSLMTPERVIRWLFDFGAGYVRCRDLYPTWANDELIWRIEVNDGYLKPQRIFMRQDGYGEGNKPYMSRVKLSQKALDLLKEKQNGI
jgi:hypothetical protein